jgi:hypothetical protein
MSDRPSPGLTILDSMILIAGVSFGLWLFQDELKTNGSWRRCRFLRVYHWLERR